MTTEKHMITNRVDQPLSNSAIYEHGCLGNIKKLYKSAGKCYDQQNHKAINEAEMFSAPEGFTDNSSMSFSQSVTMKNTSAGKLLRQFLEKL